MKINNNLTTVEYENLDEQNILNEYPYPQFQRNSFYSLNGTWDYTIYNKKDQEIKQGQILVPFCLESIASKVNYSLKKGEYIIYKRKFRLKESFLKEKTEIHFLGVDQVFSIELNGVKYEEKAGLGLPTKINITSSIQLDNELKVIVKDDLDSRYPYGKQSKHPKGIFYTPISGIYFPVFIQSIPNKNVSSIKLTPSMNQLSLKINSNCEQIKIEIYDEGKLIKEKDMSKNRSFTFTFANPKIWSLDNPFLYDLVIKTETEEIKSYFALRSLSMKNGYCYLNNKRIMIKGILDQGYYPESLYTPVNYDCYKKDILRMKELGFNTLRKHIKIECPYFYYLCDKHGMLIFQDFVNNGKYNFFLDTALPTIGLTKLKDKRLNKNKQSRANFINHYENVLNYLYNYPSIIGYTIFNEGWGQFCSDEQYENAKSIDSTRLFDTTSGWFHNTKSDFNSYHLYFNNINKLNHIKNKPIFLSEFGGYSLKIKNHNYSNKEFGYKTFKTKENFEKGVFDLFNNKILPYKNILCGFIYTQLSDIETEENGFLTYDRKILKIDKDEFKKLLILLDL